MGWHFSKDKRTHPDFRDGKLPPSDRVVLDNSSPIIEGLWDCRLYDKGNVRNIAGIEIDNPGGTISHSFDDGSRGLDFDGSSQKITISPPVDRFDEYTKYAVVRPEGFSVDNLISGNANNEHAFWFNNTNRVEAGHNGIWDYVNYSGLVAGEVYRVAVTYENLTFKLYVDGVEVDSNTGGIIADPSGTSPTTYIASYNGGVHGEFGLFFTAIWDRALSPEEVKGLYKREALELLEPAVPLQYYTPSAGGGGGGGGEVLQTESGGFLRGFWRGFN